MRKIEEAAKNAELLGFAKYTSDSGVRMVISTQDEIDAVIKQAIANASQREAKGDNNG